MDTSPEIKLLGRRAILVNFPAVIDENILEQVLALKNILRDKTIKVEVEVASAYHSLLISYPNDIENVYDEVLAVEQLIKEPNIHKSSKKKLFHVPVCYDQDFGLDLKHISRKNELHIEEIIRLHSSSVYTVYFTGFLPGFLYLGGLDKRLWISRRNEPRLEVQKGAVGIGESQTGIYPQTSPGGWQIIGNSPVPLFDPKHEPPCEISAGDKLKFYSVSREKHQKISEEVRTGTFRFEKEVYES